MMGNMKMLFNAIKSIVETKFADRLPTEDEIYFEAGLIRNSMVAYSPISDDEFEILKKELSENILHSIGYANTLRLRVTDHSSGWYFRQENDNYFWNRYKEYLSKKWSKEIVDRLHDTTSGIMDDLGDPTSDKPFQRRGLLLGDVQSGKTATYTAICNKSADVGYKVIIVLAGMMENLRIQTQERLDAEFVGLDSKYDLDKKADNELRNIRVGVGKVLPIIQDKRITRFTSVTTDFKASTLKAMGLNLNDLKGTALFVVKKNKSILNNLQKWLTKDEDILNLPLLLIDDEADNASVNTNSEENDPTAINAAINKILRSFKQATYLGITATPFANIFITPDIEADGAAKDLFPRHFLTLLPTPDRYIGADRIFGNGNADEWFTKSEEIEREILSFHRTERANAEFMDALVAITNEEQEEYFYYKHKKDIIDDLVDLPPSLCEAVRYFILCTMICDIRFDVNEHRSMLVNVSRFTDVQNKLAELISDCVSDIRSAVENYSQLPIDEAMKIKEIALLKEVWDEYELQDKVHKDWNDVLKNHLFRAVNRIEVRAVNQSTGAKSLDYFNYKGTGMRVIAVGGNSLSRGLTLEGLCVSYFYRNTMMYDTLLQMGRWFGYRPNYEDLFRIWMGEDAIDWYGYITDAFNELKEELRIMARQNRTPEEFGLKVRQAPESLIVTARNKMRTGTIVDVPINLSAKLIETPRLLSNVDVIKENNTLCESIIRKINSTEGVSRETDDKVRAYIWRNVPCELVIELVEQYKTHPWSLNFQATAIAELIRESTELEKWDVAIPFGSKDEDSPYKLNLGDGDSIDIYGEKRKMIIDGSGISKMLRINEHHVRVGAGGCTKIGLSQDKIEELRKAEEGKITDKTYLKTKRQPIALIHLMKNKEVKPELEKFPTNIYAIGLGFPGNGEEKRAKYVVNTIELKNYMDIDLLEDDDDDI